MRWTDAFLVEVTEQLQQLGMRACPVCGSEASLGTHRLPVLLLGGGLPPVATGRPHPADPEQQTDFAVRIECTACGYVMLFNAEQYRTGDQEIVVRGPTDQEEDQLGQS